MKIKKSMQRVLSAFLTFLLIVSLLPVPAYAEGTQTYTKITDSADFTTGQYVMVVDTGHAVGPMDGT